MNFSKQLLKRVLLDNQKDIERYVVFKRDYDLDSFPLLVFVGVRRSGKSYLLYQKIHSMLESGHKWDEMLYLDFEDSRLTGFTFEDLNLILECHLELYGRRPMLFLDELQNIDGWEKYARSLADKKYSVFITGSNAKMLSKEIMASLGGRYLPVEVYPFSLAEYMSFKGIPYDDTALTATESKAAFLKEYEEYFRWGGLPESINLTVKRNYLSSVFQKIYLGDIIQRNNISNSKALQLMIKKLTEGIMHPISYTRLSNILSGISGKISVPTISSYITHCEDARLLLRLRNINSAFVEKESVCRYYLVDNGLISIQMTDADTILLENIVAIELFRRYGHDEDNQRIWFYSDNIEVDFYIPEDRLAIQASFSINSEDTLKREVDALTKFAKVKDCSGRLIITYDEERVLQDQYGEINVIPYWKWALPDTFYSLVPALKGGKVGRDKLHDK